MEFLAACEEMEEECDGLCDDCNEDGCPEESECSDECMACGACALCLDDALGDDDNDDKILAKAPEHPCADECDESCMELDESDCDACHDCDENGCPDGSQCPDQC